MNSFYVTREVQSKLLLLLPFVCLITFCRNVSVFGQNSTHNIPTPAFSFLTLAPDARSAALGESGVASNPDANSAYWNASKLAFANSDFGASVSYTPWLRNIVDNVWLGYLSAYKKIGLRQAIAVSANYFNGEYIAFGIPTNGNYDPVNSRALNISYAGQLGKNFSMGLTFKYIYSGLPGSQIVNGISLRPARTVAADLSAFYHKQTIHEAGGRALSWSFGAVISNFGGKVNYGPGTFTESFIPTMFKLGGGLSVSPNGNHHFNFLLDASKLLVPTPNNYNNFGTKPYIQGVLQSFSDAPGGFDEEIQEINLSGGTEYWYKNIFALRGGYHGENRNKGDRKYFTTGAGVRIMDNYCLDASYLFPVKQGSPLAQTFRITASVYFGKTGKISSLDKSI